MRCVIISWFLDSIAHIISRVKAKMLSYNVLDT